MEKLDVIRCTHLYAVDPERAVRGEDEARLHLWGSAPTIEQTEHGPVAWWLCGRCPARVLHDPETEDGFPAEPIVVYPASCFEQTLAAGAEIRDPAGSRWLVLSVGVETAPLPGLHGERAMLKAIYGGGTLNASLLTVLGWIAVASCGCPRRASGDVVHLEGCPELPRTLRQRISSMAKRRDHNVTEGMGRAHAMLAIAPGFGEGRGELALDDDISDDAFEEARARAIAYAREAVQAALPGSLGESAWQYALRLLGEAPGPPEPAPIVHPPTDPPPIGRPMFTRAEIDATPRHDHGCGAPHVDGRCMAGDTDPAPPSEEITWEGDKDEEPPTLKRITPVHVESASSVFERVERLFGRPILGDAR